MLASNPSRNSRPELITNGGQGMFFPACPKYPGTGPTGKRDSGPGVKKDHTGVKDSVMPEKRILRALAF
jgi:hypothetical protein